MQEVNLTNSAPPKAQKELLTAQETMDFLGISRNSFDRFKEEGILKVYRLKRKLYCKRSEIMEALQPVEPAENVEP